MESKDRVDKTINQADDQELLRLADNLMNQTLQVKRTFSLVEIETGIQSIAEEVMAYHETGEQPPEELLDLLVAGMDAAVDKRDRVAKFFRFADTQTNDIDQEIARLEQRKMAIEQGTERLRAHLHRWMLATGNLELKGRLSTLKIAKVADSCTVTNVEVLADEFIAVPKPAPPPPRAADKGKLLKAMKAAIADTTFQATIAELDDAGKQQAIRNMIKERFPGAEIVNGKTRLMIK